MVKIGYLECPTGIAGDMCLGALVDAGVPWDYLVDSLKSLGIASEYQLSNETVIRNGQSATKVHVSLTHHHHHHHHDDHHSRHLPEIQQLISNASISERAKLWSLEVFQTLAVAESQVHGIAPEQVHFHEVGATDAIVDIVGTCIGLDWLDIERLYCSAMPTGGGTVKAAHGVLSVPVPAVVKLWQTREIPVYSNGIKKELVTPTGAAIAVTLAKDFGEPPAMKLIKVGLGAGSKDLAIPNILRLWIGETSQPQIQFEQEKIVVLETQIDDLNPQAIAYTLEQLLAAGALDVFTQGVGMKKSRQGILLTVICSLEIVNACKTIIFQETTTLGIRERIQYRSILNRQIETITTEFGSIRMKIASYGQGETKQVLNVQPEYEDCAKLAREHNLPWRELAQKAIALYHNSKSDL